VSARAGRLLGWTIAVGGVAAVHALTLDRSPLVRMVAIIAVLFAGMKAVVVAEWAACGVSLPPLRLLAFTTLWPGMRPHVFAHTRSLALATVVLLPALSLTLHFGVFGVLAGLWRCAGASTARLFRNPLRSRSLAEFWSERWNLAFSEMTAVAVYRPVAAGLGRNAGLLAAFVASGLAHEAAISLPVRAGYGLPLLYFVLHGVLVLVEQRWDPPLAWARLWTLGTLALPLPLLFHPPFLRGIVWPFLA
jgi:hypothetical protein